MNEEATTAEQATSTPAKAPAIGQPWPDMGGIYAGVTRGQDGQPDAHLILCPLVPAKRLAWQPALDWAIAIEHEGHTDFHVPSRTESALLYANLRDQLDQESWHWTSTQYSDDDAFGQYFDYGDQYDDDKKYEARVRAVRRFAA